MRLRIALVLGLVATLALSVSTMGRAGSGDKVTGGGQTDVSTRGAGDTIAFTAQQLADGRILGQVQYVDRKDGNGQPQVVYHGIVECLVVSGNTADFSGEWRDGGEFEIVVQDTGEGNGNADPIGIEPMATNPDCGDDDMPENNDGGLSRGNAQVHDAP